MRGEPCNPPIWRIFLFWVDGGGFGVDVVWWLGSVWVECGVERVSVIKERKGADREGLINAFSGCCMVLH